MQITGEMNISTTNATTTTTSAPVMSSIEGEVMEIVSEEMIFACCQRGDIAKLRLWTSRGVKVLFSEVPFMSCGTI
jgi:hypothetical protein